MTNKRVSAIILDEKKILLVHRIKIDKDYFVLPGGSVEKEENNIEALIREIKEETNLNVQIDKELWKINNNFDQRTQYIYLITKYSGNLELGSPEKERQSEDNKYFLEWHKIKDLKNIKFFPEEIKDNILKTFLVKKHITPIIWKKIHIQIITKYNIMKKSILLVDWLLIILFVLIIVSKFINLPFTKVVQPIFFVLTIIHIIQHWKVIVHSLKGLKKDNFKT